MKLLKCEFNVESVDFLGYTISRRGVSMEQDRIKAISEWPALATFRGVQVFLRFANFYQRFVESYSKIVQSLTSLMKGSVKGKQTGPFVWGGKQ